MATLLDLGVSAAINVTLAFLFLLAFAVLRLHPMNDRPYYAKWYLLQLRQKQRRKHPPTPNPSWKAYLRFLDWMREALRMPQQELIHHAGFDSIVFLRIFLVGLKVFIPLMLLGFAVLVPVNVTAANLNKISGFLSSDIDKLSISNVKEGSERLWVHVSMAYLYTAWICAVLYLEYQTVSDMRLRFHEEQHRRPDHFTVLVRNIPYDRDQPANIHIEHFFRVNHPEYYLTHQIVYNGNKLSKLVKKKKSLQNWLDYYELKYTRKSNERPMRKTGLLSLWGQKVDSINYYTEKINKLTDEISLERDKVLDDANAILPVAFVSFKARWGAAVAAQTQQTRNPTTWLTEWAPEPRDIYWDNLSIPFVELTIRQLIMTIALFFLVFFFMIPISAVQSLANLDGISRSVPFLRPLQRKKFVSSFLQGFLPGLVLKIFLLLLPKLLMIMSKVEGHTSLSALERRTAAKYYYFMVINVFFGSILVGAAYQQLYKFLHESPADIPQTIGLSVAQKATFFMTFIMVDGWAGIAGEILRLKPVIIYHLKNTFLVKTEKDRDKAMDPGSIGFDETLPKVELYFLLGIIYAVITPVILPFIIIYFAFAYIVYRNQVINVHNQEYESAGAFWPHFHGCIVSNMIIQQLSLMGLLATKKAKSSTPILLFLPVLTFAFHKYCKSRFEPAFRKYPLEEAMAKDTLERATDPNFSLKSYVLTSYMHPVFKDDDEVENDRIQECSEEPALIPTKRQSRANTPCASVENECPWTEGTTLLEELRVSGL